MFNIITLFIYITSYVGLAVFYKIFLTLSLNDEIFCKTLSIKENTDMDLNNAMMWKSFKRTKVSGKINSKITFFVYLIL